MKMDGIQLATELDRGFDILEKQFQGVTHEQARFKPAPEKWSMLEVLVHLWEEEHLDFRPRLASTLEDPQRPWPPIDPEGWVEARQYNQRDLEEALEGFRRERLASCQWLRTLSTPAWDHAYAHPLGKIRAGDLMVSWLAHDQLHIRQLATVHAAWLADQASPYSTRYAAP